MILGCVESWSGTIVVNYACVWFIIHRVMDVVYLLDCYAIYYLHWMTCMMKLLFLYWTNHHKTYIIWDSPSYTQFVVAYIFFRWGPTRTRYWASSWEWTIRLITIVVIFFFCLFWIDWWHVAISLGMYKFFGPLSPTLVYWKFCISEE